MYRQSMKSQICISLHLQADQQRKRLTTQVVSLTHFIPVSHFYNPCGFLTFSGGIEM